MKRVIIGLPGNNFSRKFLISWTEAFSVLMSRYSISMSMGYSSFVSFARMQTLGYDTLRGESQKPFEGRDYDVFVTIDSDMVFSPEQLIELIEATDRYEVVSGYYKMADNKRLAVVREWNTEYFSRNGTFQFLTPEDIPQEPFEAAYAGMGFMALTKRAMDSLEYPAFFHELVEMEGPDGKRIRELVSEDVAFCRNLQKKGYNIMVIPSLRVGHEKTFVI
jgi:cellulose synthase/poly-beta-1,6-N-acetylglucosamine synthase-like glycosyltransferase